MRIATLFSGLLLLVGNSLSTQELAGTYTAGLGGVVLTRLILDQDGTFSLQQTDPVFTNTFARYTADGNWANSGDTVWLNPQRAPRKPAVRISATAPVVTTGDSLTFRLRYFTEEYDEEEWLSKAPYPIEQVTIYLDKRRRGYNVVTDPIIRHCAFAPRVRRQVVVRPDGTFCLPVTERPERIGVLTYGFDDVAWLSPPPGSSFDIEIIQPLDINRTPRRKAVIVRKNRAYFYESRGRVRTGGWLTPLVKTAG